MSDTMRESLGNAASDTADVDVMMAALSEAMREGANLQAEGSNADERGQTVSTINWVEALSFDQTMGYLSEIFKGVSARSLIANKLSSMFGSARTSLFSDEKLDVASADLSTVDEQLMSFGLPSFVDFTGGLKDAVMRDVDELLIKLEQFTDQLTTDKFESVVDSKVKKAGNEALSFFMDNIGPFLGIGTVAVGGFFAYLFWKKKAELSPLTEVEISESERAEEAIKRSAFSFLLKKEDADNAKSVSFKISDLMRCNTMDMTCALHYEKIIDFFVNEVEVRLPDLDCRYEEALEITSGLSEFSVRGLETAKPADYDITVTDREGNKYKGTFMCSRWNNEVELSPRDSLSKNFVVGMSGFLLCVENGSVVDISLRAEFVKEAGFVSAKYKLEDLHVERMEFVEF